MKKNIGIVGLLILLFGLVEVSFAYKTPPALQHHLAGASHSSAEAHGKKWMISTQGSATTQIASEVMKRGGTLVDAAVAASFAISVERPHSTGLGGGGFLIYHEAKTGKNYAFDFRERAPLLASHDMYLDHQRNVIPGLSVTGSIAVGTPGMVRGLESFHHQFGTLAWSSLITPAAKLAKTGIKVYEDLANALSDQASVLSQYPSSRAIFIHPNGRPYRLGETLVQKDLATSLEKIAKDPEEVYTGSIAQNIVATMKDYNGLISAQDLSHYVVIQRTPLESDWLGYHVISMPPPSSGGVHLIQILKMLENDHLAGDGFFEADNIHLLASTLQMAFADRSVYLGDPDFVDVPVKGLLNQDYLISRRAEIIPGRARKMSEVSAGDPVVVEEENNTTHFSMMDVEGNVVVSTQTINGWFGSGLVAEGTGIMLNNQMDDFSAKPGAPNEYGNISSERNSIAPKKTPLSSMSPTIVLKGNVPVLAIGAEGGPRIISSVVQAVLSRLMFHKSLYDSLAGPRIHQQWTPDLLYIENGKIPGGQISTSTISTLKHMGWKISRGVADCAVMAVSREINPADGTQDLVGVSDPRDIGTSAGE